MAMRYIIFLLILTGCKAVERYKAGPQFPADCAAMFPIKSDTVYRPGKVDTIPGKVVDCDSVAAQYEAWWRARQLPGVDTVWLETIRPATRVQCPPATVRVDSVVVVQENTAGIAACEREKSALEKELHNADAKIEQLEAEKEAEQAAKRNWRKYTFWLLGLIAAGILWRFRHGIIGFFSRIKG